MKKSLHSLFIAAIVSVAVVGVHAAEAVSEAVVLKVKGGAQASLPGQTAPVEIKVGDTLPQGTTIETPGNAEVEIQTIPGSTTLIEAGSKVNLSKLSLTSQNGVITKQSALLDLSIGSVVSTLDPANKAINDYGIRTSQGVAAARGTKYTVSVSATGVVRTFVTIGVVVFINPTTGQEVRVQPGYAVTVAADGTISEPVEASAEQRALAREVFRNDPARERAVDITVSPSS